MAFCGFAKGAAMYDSTPIENLFLTEYLPAAPELCLKVYLYARMLALHPELDAELSDMAKALRADEDAVLDAMAYWEQQGLARRIADRPPQFELTSLQGGGVSAMDRSYYEYRDFNDDLQSVFGANLLHPSEFSRAVDWINILRFEQDAVLLAVRHEAGQSRSKSPKPSAVFKRLDRKMQEWADRGLRTAAALEREFQFTRDVQDTASALIKRFGLRRAPTEDELIAVRRWLEEWNYTPDQILAACAETTKAQNPSVAYLDSILKNRLSEDSVLYPELADILRELRGPGEPPTPDELARYAGFRGQGFEFETVKLAAVQCHRKGRTRFENLEWMLEEWQKLGLFGRDAAEEYVRSMNRQRARMRELMARCGLERAPRMDDLQRLERWQAGLPDEVIDFAADCAKGMQKPVSYMDKLLTDWAANGIDTLDAARARHEAHAAAKPAGGAAKPGNPALDYQQREYTAEEDEGLFVNLEEYLNKEGDGA